jgi:hypothetical protein
VQGDHPLSPGSTLSYIRTSKREPGVEKKAGQSIGPELVLPGTRPVAIQAMNEDKVKGVVGIGGRYESQAEIPVVHDGIGKALINKGM